MPETSSRKQPKREATQRKHERIRSEFHELFDKKRKREDDAINDIAERWFLSKAYVERIVFYGG
jgi:hypothetical protein